MELVLGEEDAPVPRQTALVEHCMMVTGEERLRVKLTLSVAGTGNIVFTVVVAVVVAIVAVVVILHDLMVYGALCSIAGACASHTTTTHQPGGQDGTELDIEVLRVALLAETWEGEGPEGWTNTSIFKQQPTQQPLVTR